MESDLQQNIAEFLGEVGSVVLVDGVNCLVAFLYEVAAERLVRLRAIPGATLGSAQFSDDR